MQIPNPLTILDWEIKAFLKAVFSVQLAVFIFVGLGTIGFDVPVVRALICFVYLTFVPGLVVLRALKLHGLNVIESYLYTVALSIAMVMFIGLLADTILPTFGFLHPLSLLPTLTIISAFVLSGCFISYKTDAGFSAPSVANFKSVLSPAGLFLCLIPFLAILGTYLVNYYQNSIVLMCMILLIGILVVLIGFDKIPRVLYPLSIVVIALSLLFHNSLISSYPTGGGDIGTEFAASLAVLINRYWDPTAPQQTEPKTLHQFYS